MPRYQKFFNEIAKLRSEIRGTDNVTLVKTIIGDSTTNNRTPTVNQVIRFLTVTGQENLAKELDVVYCVLQSSILTLRSEISSRTDAVDLNDFVASYRELVMNHGWYRQEIGRLLNKVG